MKISFPPMNTLGVTLYGGLGNRLFQAASCYSIALDKNKNFLIINHANNIHSSNLYLDTVFKKLKSDYTVAPYFINNKNYIKTLHLPQRLEQLTDEYIDECRNIKEPTSYRYDLENSPYDYIDFPDTFENIYIGGYLQNTKYFNKRRKEILELFSPNEEILKYITTNYSKEKLDNSISLHIRISDDEQHYNNYDNYYCNSINSMKEKFGNDVHFYIFCNRNNVDNINLLNYTIVKDEEVISLYLISMCRLGCINYESTFSWWGNYLNTNEDKIFITNMKIE